MNKIFWYMAKKYWTYIKVFWILVGVAVLSVVLVFTLASYGVFGYMPPFKHLENPDTNLATEFLSSDGQTLGKLYLNDNRTPVSYEELPEKLVHALVATEDARYYDHAGIDLRGTLRALVYLGRKGGASTISQQLSRQLFVGVRSRNKMEALTQKIKEWVIAVRLERNYTKEEIIAMYLNIYDFNYNADGIRSASRIYFGKEPMELRAEEAAVLVGMLKNSSLYNPIRREDLVFNRRNTVLTQMAKYGYLTEKEKDSLQKLPMRINFNPESHREGLATYFRMYMQRWLRDWVQNNPKRDGSRFNIYQDGLKIYTTIDSRLQNNAEEAVEEHMKRLQAEFFVQNTPDRNRTTPFSDLEPNEIGNIMERAMKNSIRWKALKRQGMSEKEIRANFKEKTDMVVFDWNSDSYEKDTIMSPLDSIKYYKSFLRTAVLSMEPQTGHVKAWVGGVDYKHFQYDNVIQGARQVGSTFKPFVYAAAIDQLRLSPCDSMPDNRYCIEPNKYGNLEAWCPKNSNGKYSLKYLTLKNALANSVNTVSAQLIDKVGPASVVALAKNMGLDREIPEVPSIALGTTDFNVYDLVGAYGTFVNQGVYVKPVMVIRIEDKNGTLLWEYTPETRDVLSKEIAYVMLNLMEGVTESGSGARLKHRSMEENIVYKEVVTGYPYNFTNPIAGKTGTTQNQSDGWFIGMVPNLVTGVWVGGEDRSVHFSSTAYGQGATMALPIWALYMQRNYSQKETGISRAAFPEPELLTIPIDCAKLKEETREELDLDDDLDDLDF